MKVQELNYENIPVIEEKRGGVEQKACPQLRRRVICAKVGKADYVESEVEVGHSAGRFLRIQPDELKSFLRGPITHSVYMKDYVAEFASAYSVQDCASTISNLCLIDGGYQMILSGWLGGFRGWAASRLGA